MRLLVAGATGYLGAWLSEWLAEAGHEVMGWGRRRPPQSADWAAKLASFDTGDVTDDDTLDRMADQVPDGVVYTVSLDHGESERDVRRAMEVNVAPVWRLLDRLTRQGKPLRFLYLSTAQVYGPMAGVVDESTPVNPRNHYGLTHLLAEDIGARYHAPPDVKYINLRLANGYGAPRFADANCWWLVINDFCRSAMSTGEVVLKSDGSPQRNFVHIRDIAQAAKLLLETPELAHRTYNVGGEKTHTVLELAHLTADVFERKFGKRPKVRLPGDEISENADAHRGLDRFEYRSDRLGELGYCSHVGLEKGIEEVLNYVRETMSRTE